MNARELPAGDWRRAVYGRATISGIGTRRRPRTTDRARVQRVQGGRCLYCDIPIGTTIYRGPRAVVLRTNWDHFVPYSYLARNPDTNWVLACHVCNGIKSCRMFDTVQAACDAILPIRAAKGYEDPKAVLLRLGIAPDSNPWPDRIRLQNGHTVHVARMVRDGMYLTACSRHVPAHSAVEPEGEVACRICETRRDLPVIIPTPRSEAS